MSGDGHLPFFRMICFISHGQSELFGQFSSLAFHMAPPWIPQDPALKKFLQTLKWATLRFSSWWYIPLPECLPSLPSSSHMSFKTELGHNSSRKLPKHPIWLGIALWSLLLSYMFLFSNVIADVLRITFDSEFLRGAGGFQISSLCFQFLTQYVPHGRCPIII